MEKQEPFQDSFKFKAWQQKLEHNQIRLNQVQDVYTRHGNEGQVLHSLVKLDATAPDGAKLSPLCMIKGDAISVLVVLIDEETEDKFVLMVRQRRVCDGSETYEHPAGMIDEGETPPEVALRELQEETGLEFASEELQSLGPKPWYSATSTSDEALYFFYCERRMNSRAIRELHGQSTGKASEQEQTRLHVAPLAEAHGLVSNLHGVLGHLLYLRAVGDYDTLKTLPF
ncbi:NUDIX hydrolase [Larkinella insperata]|uniref:GDP-mannose pyrophosphatase n=1 Tax=Larkinella insperata TaxID=332158 RepID=A0ABW3Q6E2_9BACT|nr:NUDIX hydrolase [Larkinella insperata]